MHYEIYYLQVNKHGDEDANLWLYPTVLAQYAGLLLT
jgi:hypothetical protein